MINKNALYWYTIYKKMYIIGMVYKQMYYIGMVYKIVLHLYGIQIVLHRYGIQNVLYLYGIQHCITMVWDLALRCIRVIFSVVLYWCGI